MIRLFKTENCKACHALITEMTSKGVTFQFETDLEVAKQLGIRSAPALIMQDGSVLRTPQEIIKFLKNT